MEEAIKLWCDRNIAPGMCYRGSLVGTGPIVEHNGEGKLIYQDGTGCSASCAFSDVYQTESGEYNVYTMYDTGFIKLDFDGYDVGEQTVACKFNKLSEVVEYIADFS